MASGPRRLHTITLFERSRCSMAADSRPRGGTARRGCTRFLHKVLPHWLYIERPFPGTGAYQATRGFRTRSCKVSSTRSRPSGSHLPAGAGCLWEEPSQAAARGLSTRTCSIQDQSGFSPDKAFPSTGVHQAVQGFLAEVPPCWSCLGVGGWK